ncbi:MAG: CpaD family pilus assembly lipoprotein [Pseudomonadota bacterium]
MSRVKRKLKPMADCQTFRAYALRASLVALALSVGGCASFQKDHFKVGSIPEDYRTKHPIVVSQSEVTEDLIITPSMNSMSFRHQNVVNDFLSRFRRSGAKSLRIVLPAGSHNESAARRVTRDIIQHMKDERVGRDQITVTRYHAANHGDSATIRLSFNAVGAHVASQCGQWTEDLVNNSENLNYKNFGCATQNNLAEMIANPEDLISPRGQSEIDAERRDNVINDWRTNGTASLPQLL